MTDLPETPDVRFRHAVGLDGYAVGDDGSVWSSMTRNGTIDPGWRQVSQYRRPYGSRYVVVSLRLDGGRGKVTCRYVHRLVLEAFVGPGPAGNHALHGDGDTANNRLANLRWGTPVENAADKVKHGTHHRGVNSVRAALTLANIKALAGMHLKGKRQSDIAKELRVHPRTVSCVVRGKTYKAEFRAAIAEHGGSANV